jgi:hypothetical protein
VEEGWLAPSRKERELDRAGGRNKWPQLCCPEHTSKYLHSPSSIKRAYELIQKNNSVLKSKARICQVIPHTRGNQVQRSLWKVTALCP